MSGKEWSRSRYWLCHFLNGRHERPRIDWAIPTTHPGTPIVASLGRLPSPGMVNEAALAMRVAVRDAADPAMVQSVRLMLKERHHHHELMSKVRSRFAAGTRAPGLFHRLGTALAHALGVRFELSLFLLADILDTTVLRKMESTLEDAPSRQALQSILRERRSHVAFLTERLTMELADLNFVRRNLRRWRLRAMFILALAWTTLIHGRSLGSTGTNTSQFVLEAWHNFRTLLERMVPYHRDTLIRALLSQSERPYDKTADTGL